ALPICQRRVGHRLGLGARGGQTLADIGDLGLEIRTQSRRALSDAATSILVGAALGEQLADPLDLTRHRGRPQTQMSELVAGHLPVLAGAIPLGERLVVGHPIPTALLPLGEELAVTIAS